ncbi:MAG: hypothetical protein EOM44_00545 [Bacteroidia bacterium]|nr:hypothetical protein [Bacteroidia bacterium]
MKVIYSALIARLKEKVPSLKWIDWDTAQLETQAERPAVRFPCALISIGITSARDIVETSQYCEANISIRLAFDPMERTNSEAPPEAREQALQPYDVIADTYAALQGFETPHFHALSRTSQAKENNRLGLFVYRITFKTDFEDDTAEE